MKCIASSILNDFFFPWQISRSSANCSLRSGLLNDVSSVYLSYTFCKRSLTHNPKAFVRGYHLFLECPGTELSSPICLAKIAVCCGIVWKVMEMCYKILGEGKLVQQRELFYKLLSDSPKYFSCQRHVNQAIQGGQNPPPQPNPFDSCLANV